MKRTNTLASLILLAGLVLLPVLALFIPQAPAHAEEEAGAGKILFLPVVIKNYPFVTSGRFVYDAKRTHRVDGKNVKIWDIYLNDAEGDNESRLTQSEADDMSPTWSPDGTKIAYYSNINNTGDGIGDYDIFVQNANGVNTRLTSNTVTDAYPAWSPDGKKIAYASGDIPEGDYRIDGHIYIMNADGTNAQRLTDEKSFVESPTWSPDGNHIAFISDGNIWRMEADGDNPVRLTNTSDTEEFPDWSPNGLKIVYQSGGEIFVMDANGNNPVNISNNPGIDDTNPTYSPDGLLILFSSTRRGEAELFVMGEMGANPQPFATPIYGRRASWAK